MSCSICQQNSDLLMSNQFLRARHNSSFAVLSLWLKPCYKPQDVHVYSCEYNYRKFRATLFGPGQLRNQGYWAAWPPGTEVTYTYIHT